MTEATERPWVILDTNQHGDICFGPVSGGQVGLVQPHPLRTLAEQEASAELLVRAVSADDAAEALAEAAQQAWDWLDELREDWRRGVLTGHDTKGRGGYRSNRNVDVEVALRKALAVYRAARED